MVKKTTKKTIVRSHSRRVPISEKNPTGTTIVDRHSREYDGQSLDRDQIKAIVKAYPHKNLLFPSVIDLGFRFEKQYDILIAIWCDFFNKKFPASEAIDPNVLKALIASESSFHEVTPKNSIAFGIAQITKETLKVVQDPAGETRNFIFKKIRLKDLHDPDICIAIAARWLFRKRETAKSKLKRIPSNEELILEYKGLLKSSTRYKDKGLENFRTHYEKLIGK